MFSSAFADGSVRLADLMERRMNYITVHAAYLPHEGHRFVRTLMLVRHFI
jgi:hypothetical protein